MLAGTIAVLDAPADEPLTDTTLESEELPAVAVNNEQADLEGDTAVQHCTVADYVYEDAQVPLVYEGGITTETEERRQEVVSELVADVTDSGLLIAERVKGTDEFAFPFNRVAQQTGRGIERREIDVSAFADALDDGSTELMDTWLVGTDDGEGVSMDYNEQAEVADANKANVGLGFTVSWNSVVGEGVLYGSGYIAIYSSWGSSVFAEFVKENVLPHSVLDDDADGQQATLAGED
jgi:hypothetical protein